MPIDISKFVKSYEEPKPLQQGAEVKLRIENAEATEAKSSGNPMIAIRLSVPSEPASLDIYHNVMLPCDAHPPKSNNQIIKRLADFCQAFGAANPLKTPKFDETSWIGLEAYAVLNYEDAERGPRNSVKQFTRKA